MKTDRQSRLEILAYKIWEERGCPEGRDQENWAEAERRLRFESDGPTDSRVSDAPERETQDTPGRSNPSSSRQQTQPGQTTQTSSRELDRKSTLSTRNRPR